MMTLSRREFLAAAAAPLALTGCTTEPEIVGPARLRLRARKPSRGTLTGMDVLYGEDLRRAYIRVPPTYDPAKASPLIIALHGAGGRGDTLANAFGSRTDSLGAIVLAPNSAFQTWDMFGGETTFATDVPFFNLVLDQVFDRCNIDTSRIAILGFSDGGSYAITLGISNGDQLAGVVAFSPGYYVIDNPQGVPRYFISHGTSDTVLPIEETSRKIVPELKARGSLVTYEEFDGGHEVPAAIADHAMAWLTTTGFHFPIG